MLKKQRGKFYIRLLVPSDLTNSIGVKELVRSAKTSYLREAKNKDYAIVGKINGFWNQVRIMKRTRVMTDAEIKQLVNDWLNKELEEYSDKLTSPLWLTSSRTAEELEFTLDELNIRKRNADAMLHSPLSKSILYRDLIEEVLDGKDLDGKSYGIFVRTLADAIKKQIDQQKKTAISFFEDDKVALEVEEVKDDSILFSVAIDIWLKTKKDLSPNTYRACKMQMGRVLEIIGNKPIDKITREELIDLKDNLINSKNFNISEYTAIKHLHKAKEVFNEAVNAGHLNRNLFPKIKEAPEKPDKEKRQPFSEEDLDKLFSSPTYADKKIKTKNPERYWIPLIMLHSGTRPDETCQLFKEDIILKDGIHCFQIDGVVGSTKPEQQKVKNESSKRIVPIHPRLIELGLLDYVKTVDHKQLWPNLKWGNHGFSTTYSAHISRYVREHVTGDKRIVLYSLKSNFVTGMNKVNSRDLTSAAIGHSSQHEMMEKHYHGRLLSQVLFEAIKKVHFPCTDKLL